MSATMRNGERMPKLAMQGLGIIRTYAEHVAHMRNVHRMRSALLATIKANASYAYDDAESAYDRDAARAELREATVPVYGVLLVPSWHDRTTNGAVYGDVYYVSADVLVDWRREYGADCIVVRAPYRPWLGSRGIGLVDAYNEALAESRAQRRNEAGLGRAQNAYRVARLEGDMLGMQLAYSWLWHGSLEPCRADECEQCQRDIAQAERQWTAYKISLAMDRYHRAFTMLALAESDLRPGRQPVTRHRMPAPPADWCRRYDPRTGEILATAPNGPGRADHRPDAREERERAAIERLRRAFAGR